MSQNKTVACTSIRVHIDTATGERPSPGAATNETRVLAMDLTPRNNWGLLRPMLLTFSLLLATYIPASEIIDRDGWKGESPRDELRPSFQFKQTKGAPGDSILT